MITYYKVLELITAPVNCLEAFQSFLSVKGGTARCISRVYIFSYLPLGDRGPNDKQVRCRYIDIDVQITRWSGL